MRKSAAWIIIVSSKAKGLFSTTWSSRRVLRSAAPLQSRPRPNKRSRAGSGTTCTKFTLCSTKPITTSTLHRFFRLLTSAPLLRLHFAKLRYCCCFRTYERFAINHAICGPNCRMRQFAPILGIFSLRRTSPTVHGCNWLHIARKTHRHSSNRPRVNVRWNFSLNADGYAECWRLWGQNMFTSVQSFFHRWCSVSQKPHDKLSDNCGKSK